MGWTDCGCVWGLVYGVAVVGFGVRYLESARNSFRYRKAVQSMNSLLPKKYLLTNSNRSSGTSSLSNLTTANFRGLQLTTEKYFFHTTSRVGQAVPKDDQNRLPQGHPSMSIKQGRCPVFEVLMCCAFFK